MTEGINGEGRKHDRNGARGKENPAYSKHTGDIKKSRAGYEELVDARPLYVEFVRKAIPGINRYR